MSRKEPSTLKARAEALDGRLARRKNYREPTLIRLTGAISRSCRMYADRYIAEFGLSISQAIIIAELSRHGGCSQDELRARVKLDKGNVTRALQYLEENGFVRRKQDCVDRRIIRVHATQKARSTDRKLHALAIQWNEMFTRGFSQEERQALTTLLLRMEANVQTMLAEKEE